MINRVKEVGLRHRKGRGIVPLRKVLHISSIEYPAKQIPPMRNVKYDSLFRYVKLLNNKRHLSMIFCKKIVFNVCFMDIKQPISKHFISHNIWKKYIYLSTVAYSSAHEAWNKLFESLTV